MTKDKHYRDFIDCFRLEDEDEYLITTGTEETGYSLELKKGRFGATEYLVEDAENYRDVQQVVVGMADDLGYDWIKDEVLEK